MKFLLCALLIFFVFPFRALPAEVLQVSSSSVIQIGDNNRNYKIRIACINVEESNGKDAITWLKNELPRHAKINFFPKGSEDGTLLASCLLYTSPSPRDRTRARMPSSA